MIRLPPPLKYLSELTPGKVTLWCYLIWYLVTVVNHFDHSPGIWLNSLGISAVIKVSGIFSCSHRGLQSYTCLSLSVQHSPYLFML
jgi:hypothetical protein